jgi:hypothetical protein
MASKKLVFALIVLLVFILGSCAASEISWSMRDSNDSDALRQLTGLPSVAVGNLNPSARNPGVEVFCTGLYDVPGGYCNYFSMGTPFVDFKMATNFTVTNNSTLNGSGK